jgi:hypothetical protein
MYGFYGLDPERFYNGSHVNNGLVTRGGCMLKNRLMTWGLAPGEGDSGRPADDILVARHSAVAKYEDPDKAGYDFGQAENAGQSRSN